MLCIPIFFMLLDHSCYDTVGKGNIVILIQSKSRLKAWREEREWV